MSEIKVTYIDHMGNDYSPIRAAIVSNGVTNSSKYIDDDMRYTDAAHSLINFLARGCTSGEWENIKRNLTNLDPDYGEEDIYMEEILNHVRHMPPHWTPFGHTAITVYVKAPIFVARQLGKHQTGFVCNEISRRYVDKTPEFYTPDVWRGKAADKKQGSSDTIITEIERVFFDEELDTEEHPVFDNYPYSIVGCVQDAYDVALKLYHDMLDGGVAPEQARMVLPQSMMTEWYWTGNLYGFSKMFVARTDPHTQKETRDVANMIGDVIEPLFPISWKALT